MRYLKTSEAASFLNVSPNTLRAWERRFGYPRPQRSPGHHRLFTYGEVAALRDALQEGLSISSAVSRAREGLSSDSHSLASALTSFDPARADVAMEAALALRSLERSVEEVLLPSLEEVAARHGVESAPWAFAARWGNAWLQRAQRLAPAPTRPTALVLGDASRDDLDPDAPAIRALELLCMRAGMRVLSLSVRGVSGMSEALSQRAPSAVIIAGGHLSDDDVARWAYAVRSTAGPLPVALFHRGSGRQQVRMTGATVLPGTPSEAQVRMLELAEGPARRPAASESGARPATPSAIDASFQHKAVG